MASVSCPGFAGATMRGWAVSYIATLSPGSRPALAGVAANSCNRTAQQPGRRSLFQQTAPRLRQPQKAKLSQATPSKQQPAAKEKTPFTSSTSAARLPYKSAASSSSSSSSSQSEQQKKNGKNGEPESLDSLFSQRKLPLVGAALAAGVLGFYIMPLLVTYLTGGCREDHTHEEISPDAVPTGIPPVGAAAFDASLDMPERIMGIRSQRRKLARESTGAVLEVAVGTGRNIGYYIWDPATFSPDYKRAAALSSGQALAHNGTTLTSFTGIDLSGEALGLARTQLRVTVPAVGAAISKKAPAIENADSSSNKSNTTEVVNVLDGKVRLFQGDAMQPLPPPTPAPAAATAASPLYYDTVVQTFGLCSVADPVVLLANMAAVVKPDTGRVVLLEHGRGGWPVVNALLDKYATKHFARFGCWWNRDMAAIVADAQKAVPGLEVVSVKRPGWLQFGTLWRIELRVKSAAAENENTAEKK
ncbi:hypothetical protein SCUCBS95973_005445 [Sporothrix curviconia]|uniref:Ubiquinone menaquinone biosynthesis-related protein n=1 Tax=Sporothrix curviconia TaxID=1260050 RepID=A0ABP0BWX3_9PEZI